MENERRFSRAVCAENRHAFTSAQVKIDAVECLRSVRIPEMQVPDADYVRAHRFKSRSESLRRSRERRRERRRPRRRSARLKAAESGQKNRARSWPDKFRRLAP